MNRKQIEKWIKWGIMGLAYGWLVWKLATFDGYEEVRRCFHEAQWWQYTCLLGAIGLLPLNLGLEAARWRKLMMGTEEMTLNDALRQVCYGYIGGFVTPYRIGDIPARAAGLKDKKNWPAALAMGALNAVMMTAAIVALSMPSAFIWMDRSHQALVPAIIGGILCILLLVTAPKWVPKVCHQTLNRHQLCVVLMMSAARYLTFATQMGLMLLFVGISMTWTQALVMIPTYYLFVTITPNMPVADMGIRGVWALTVFAAISPVAATQAAIAAIILWAINQIVPILWAWKYRT